MHAAVKQAIARLTGTGLASEETLKGCSDEEIEQLQSECGARFPDCYRDFLREMGRCAGEFMVGTDYSIEKMPAFRQAARQLMTSANPSVDLSDSHVVFASHQGYTFLYFDSCAGDDPPVMMYTESEPVPTQIAETFSAWLSMATEADIEAYGAE